jgi:hypothetical protein
MVLGGSVVAPTAEALAPVLTRILTFLTLGPLAAILAVAALVVARLVFSPVLTLVVLTLRILALVVLALVVLALGILALRILALGILALIILTLSVLTVVILPVTPTLTVTAILAFAPVLTLATRLIRLRRRIGLLGIRLGAEIRLRRAIFLHGGRPIVEAAVVHSLAVLAIVVERPLERAVGLLELRLSSRDDAIIMLGVLKVVLGRHWIA